MQAEKKAAKEAAKAKAASSAAPADAVPSLASSPPSTQPLVATQADSPPAAPAPAAAPAAGQSSVAPRLASSIARTGSRSSPPHPSGVEGRSGTEDSHMVPSSSSRQVPARQLTTRGSDRGPTEGTGSPMKRDHAGEQSMPCDTATCKAMHLFLPLKCMLPRKPSGHGHHCCM